MLSNGGIIQSSHRSSYRNISPIKKIWWCGASKQAVEHFLLNHLIAMCFVFTVDKVDTCPKKINLD